MATVYVGVDVFIVHAGPDKEFALQLRAALIRIGVSAFVDKADAPAGAPWDSSIDRELRESLLQVVLLGHSTRWYQYEVNEPTGDRPVILRGGCWRYQAAPLIVVHDSPRDTGHDFVGFRVVCRPVARKGTDGGSVRS